MGKEIRLSEKHGVNPMVMICYLCGNKTGVALLGRLPGDEEAPRSGCLDKEPCDECKGHMKKGVLLISVRNGSEKNPYRTGGFCVLTEEAAKRIFVGTNVLETRVAFVEDEAWDKIGLPREGEPAAPPKEKEES